MDVHDNPSAAALGVFAETAAGSVCGAPGVALDAALRRSRRSATANSSRRCCTPSSRSDPSWPPTLLWLACYAGDRGDAERGLGLLRRAGAPDGDLVQLFERFRPAARVGLAATSAAGAGRAASTRWATSTASSCRSNGGLCGYISRPPPICTTDRSGPVRRRRAGQGAVRDDVDALAEAFGDRLVCDAVLFDGGAFASRCRGASGTS